jgi:hypothetical protein
MFRPICLCCILVLSIFCVFTQTLILVCLFGIHDDQHFFLDQRHCTFIQPFYMSLSQIGIQSIPSTLLYKQYDRIDLNHYDPQQHKVSVKRPSLDNKPIVIFSTNRNQSFYVDKYNQSLFLAVPTFEKDEIWTCEPFKQCGLLSKNTHYQFFYVQVPFTHLNISICLIHEKFKKLDIPQCYNVYFHY